MPLIQPDSRPDTLVAQAHRLAQQQPDSTALIILSSDEAHEIRCGEFFAAAKSYAAALANLGVQRGDVVVLVQGHGAELLYSFWGALMLGAIPSIFPFLSDKLDPDHYFENVRQMVAHAEVRIVVSQERFIPQLRDVLPESVQIVDVATFKANDSNLPDITLQPDDVAFLQHSSGSTGIQKGVMLSHRSVINQLVAYSQAIDLRADDIIVSWLPLYHDMGLIAGFILPIMQGIPLALLSPFEWVRDPARLLYAIDRYKGTLCWLPNFAYNFMALQIRADDFDLSSIRAFINCSEPVYASSHEVFLKRFEANGARSDMLATCYAMAENTFAVTQSKIGSAPILDLVDRRIIATEKRAVPATDDAATLTMVSCGRPIPGCEIKVVDEARQTLPDRHVGEIALRSDSMLSGYHNRPEATAAAMSDGWYFTGDLGYLADGELYITGRKKDLIIVGGKNIYPQDIEYLVNEIPGVHPGRTVAFGVMNDRLATEDIAIIAEIDDGDVMQITRNIRTRIAQHTETTARHVHLVEAGWLIKTSSGKIARRANREKFLTEVLKQSVSD